MSKCWDSPALHFEMVLRYLGFLIAPFRNYCLEGNQTPELSLPWGNLKCLSNHSHLLSCPFSILQGPLWLVSRCDEFEIELKWCKQPFALSQACNCYTSTSQPLEPLQTPPNTPRLPFLAHLQVPCCKRSFARPSCETLKKTRHPTWLATTASVARTVTPAALWQQRCVLLRISMPAI